MTRSLPFAAFFVGLAAVAWVAAGYLGANPLALVVTLIVGAFFLMGALELQRFSQATGSLSRAVAGLTAPPASLGAWLDPIHPSLQNAVRLRIEGERIGLPGPALAPYLTGLLVLLGMLGTFLGMVVTLNGTGLALESSSDLQSIRASLATPVKGLGLAFGTSVAGVTASAMLGLISALCRRERLQAAQGLDAKIATHLRGFSRTHQREEAFKLLQQQTETMPLLVDRLQAMMATLEQQSHTLNERLTANQADFQRQTEARYTTLAASVDRSLQTSLAEGARLASATIQPVVEAAMSGIARETSALHDTLAGTARQQLDQLATRFEATHTRTASHWQAALAEQQRSGQALSDDLRRTLGQFTDTFDQRATALVDGVATRLDATAHSLTTELGATVSAVTGRLDTTVAGVSDRLDTTLSRLAERLDTTTGGLTERLEKTTGGLTDRLEQITGGMADRLEATAGGIAGRLEVTVGTVAERLDTTISSVAERLDTTVGGMAQRLEGTMAGASTQLDSTIAGVSQRLDATAETLSSTWREALAQHEQASQTLSRDTQQALATATAGIEQHAGAMLRTLDESHLRLQADIAARDGQRLAAWTDALAAMAQTLQRDWQQAGATTLAQQQQVCETLAQTASEMSSQAEAHARATIAEISRLVEAAAEAPRSAAEVVAELRQKLSDSMARDNAMLDERNRLLETLSALLDAVNHASTDQRAAIDALVGSSADLLDRVGARFTEQVENEAGKITGIAAQITGSAAEVASLGEAFGLAVQLFSQSNDKLVTHLQRIEGALGKSITRSDEQLAYYVAQAREVIDLSIMSQQQIVEDLQQIASRGVSAPVPVVVSTDA